MTDSNAPRRRRRRRRRFPFIRVFLLLLLLAVAAGGSWAYGQYREGQQLAGSPVKPKPFAGDAVNGDAENFLVLGVDSRKGERSRSDTMMLASWQKKTGTVKLVSFMRDIYADIPGYRHYKLNAAYFLGGPQLTKDTLTSMFGVPIHHYAEVDFKRFEKLVDILAPDGVEVDVKHEMSKNLYMTLKPGRQKLHGKQLLAFSRFRYDREGDFGRVERQQQALLALKNTIAEPRALLRFPKAAGAAQRYIETDLTEREEAERLLALLKTRGVKKLDRLRIPVDGGYSYARYPEAGSVLAIDIEKNKAAIQAFLKK